MDGLSVLRPEMWVPPQMKDAQERAAAKAVEEYDSGLILGYRNDVGEWVVFLRNGPGGVPFPALGLGSTLPAPEEIKRRLYRADTKRRGPAIVAEVERHNRMIEDRGRRAQEASIEVAAEGIEWASRKLGLRGNGKIFVPGGATT